MKYFTIEEFDEMYREIMCNETVSYEMLFVIAQKTLLGTVISWCKDSNVLDSEAYEDIMQDTMTKLMLHCITGFFSKNDGSNYDPRGFKNWMFKVARNTFLSYTEKEKKRSSSYYDPEYYINKASDEDFSDSICDSQVTIDRLNMDFMIVLDSDLSVYKVLAWVVRGIIVLSYDTERKVANKIVSDRLGKMTLDGMLDFLLREAKYVPWLKLDDVFVERIRGRLDKEHKNGKRLGNMLFSDFYMEKGAMASISDWTNRIDDYIKKRE